MITFLLFYTIINKIMEPESKKYILPFTILKGRTPCTLERILSFFDNEIKYNIRDRLDLQLPREINIESYNSYTINFSIELLNPKDHSNNKNTDIFEKRVKNYNNPEEFLRVVKEHVYKDDLNYLLRCVR